MTGAVGIVALVVVMMMVMLVMVMVVVASAVLVVMMVPVLMFVVASAVLVVMMMLMPMPMFVVTPAFSIMIVVMLVFVVMITATFSIMMVVFMLLMVVMMVVMMLRFLGKMRKLCRQRVVLLHGVKDGLSFKCIPWRGDDCGIGIMLAQKRHSGGKLFLIHARGAAENDGARVVDLVAVKFTEILHVNAALGGVGNGGEAVELDLIRKHALHRADDVGQLAHARGASQGA